MPDDLETTELGRLLADLKGGDRRAADELIRRVVLRLERLARSMLRRYPRVREREQTGDVVHEVVLSLLPALQQLTFQSTRDFYGLAAEHVRRRLLDLTRRHSRPGRDHRSLEEAAGEVDQVVARQGEADELDRWQALHEAVALLPPDQREVFGLRFYHGWSHQQIAELLQVSTKTVARVWMRAQVSLSKQMAGAVLPEAGDDVI